MSSTDQLLTTPRGITLCYRTDGDPEDRPLLLVAGLGLDLTSWPASLVDGLVGRGFYVIRFDNRDTGRSTRIDAPTPGVLRKLLARPHPGAYDLGDMAVDAVHLLDGLGLGSVDVVGMSMGGMIGQTIAVRRPDRVRTLTSLFSTTGASKVGQPARSTMLRMGKRPATELEDYVARHLLMLGHLASTTYPPIEADEIAYARRVWTRGAGAANPQGVGRQISAIQKSGDRTEEVRRITAPTLVLHGDVDLMVAPTGGVATAAAIPGSRHVVIDGLRHHLAPQLMPRLVDLVDEHVTAAATGSTDHVTSTTTTSGVPS